MAIARRIKDLTRHFKAEGSFHGLTLESGEDTVVDIHALSDDEFIERQRIKKVFAILDKNGSGTLEFSEFRRMLRLVGAVCSP